MISFLLQCIGFFLPVAHAQTLRTAGSTNPAVSAMWTHICTVLPCSTASTGPTGSNEGSSLIVAFTSAVVNFVFPLVSVVAVIMVVYAGIRIVTSDGDESKVSEAKKIIMYAAAGVILSIMTTAIVSFVTTYLGLILV